MARRRSVETEDFLKMANRIIRAAAKRVGNGDEAELAGLAALRDQIETAVGDAIQAQLEQGKSWAKIGLALGTTRQGAFRRYAR